MQQRPTSPMSTNNCTHCSALRFPNKTPSICCNQGKIVIEMLPEPPASLMYLWTAQDEEGVLFRSFIRQINNALAMASVRITEKLPPGNSFNPTVVIQGKAYFLMWPLQADAGASSKFAQLYVHDAGQTNILDYRLAKTKSNKLSVQKYSLLRSIVQKIQVTITQLSGFLGSVLPSVFCFFCVPGRITGD